MIVVVGQPLLHATAGGATAEGLSVQIALAAASHGGSVQLVGKTGEDADGDAIMLALARGGIGHVAFLRDAGMSTPGVPEPANLDPDPAGRDSGSATDLQSTPRQPHGQVSTLDAADVELALRYLTTFSVLVLGEPADPELVRVMNAAAGWADARLIVVVPAGTPVPDDLPPQAIVFEAPDEDPDGVFAEMVGSFAAALDDGDEPLGAFRATLESGGWTPAELE